MIHVSPEKMTLSELRPFMAEYLKRKRGKKAARPAILKPRKDVESSFPLVSDLRRAPSVEPATGWRND